MEFFQTLERLLVDDGLRVKELFHPDFTPLRGYGTRSYYISNPEKVLERSFDLLLITQFRSQKSAAEQEVRDIVKTLAEETGRG